MLKIKVDTDSAIRLDRYLKRLYQRLTQGVLEKALRKKYIQVNAIKTKSSHRIEKGDIIYIDQDQFDVELYKDCNQKKIQYSDEVKLLAKKIFSDYLLYECDEYIAIDKPAGLATQGGTKITLSIDDALKYLHQYQLKLVHRLDKSTSGVLLIAKGHTNSSKLIQAFKERKIQKKYLSIVSNIPKQKTGVIKNYVAKDKSGNYEIVKEVKKNNDINAKLAETKYKVVKSMGRYALIEFTPKTGRMHQLRVHSKSLGCPIVGDKKYGGKPHKRMMLHATEIRVPKEVFGKCKIIKSISCHIISMAHSIGFEPTTFTSGE